MKNKNIDRKIHKLPQSQYFKFPTSISKREENIIHYSNLLKKINIKITYFISILILVIVILVLKKIKITIFISLILISLNYLHYILKNYSNVKIRNAILHEESINFISNIIPKVSVVVGDTGAGKDTFNNVLIHADIFRMMYEDLEILGRTKKIIHMVNFNWLENKFFNEYEKSIDWFMHIPTIKNRNKAIIDFLKKNMFFLTDNELAEEFYLEYQNFNLNPELKMKYGKFNGFHNEHFINMIINYIKALNRLYIDKNKVWSNHPLREPTGLMSKILSERNLNINDIDRIPLLPEKAIFVQTEISSIQGNHLENINSIVKNTGRTHSAAYRRHIFGEDITWRAANQDPGRQVKAMRELEHSFIHIIAKLEEKGNSEKIQKKIIKLEEKKSKLKTRTKKNLIDIKISKLMIEQERYEYEFGMTEFIIHVSKSPTPVKSISKLENLSELIRNKELMLGKSYSCSLKIRTEVAKGNHNPWYLAGLKDIIDSTSKIHYANTPNWNNDMKLHPHQIKYMEQATMKELFSVGSLTDEDLNKLGLPPWYKTGATYENIEKVKTADKKALKKIVIKEQMDKKSEDKYLVSIITSVSKKYLNIDDNKLTIVTLAKASLFDTKSEAEKYVSYFYERIVNKNSDELNEIALDVKVIKAKKEEIIKIIKKRS